MQREAPRFMRIMVFFDLPVVSITNKRHYIRFRRFLLQDGYTMMQFSIYSRLCNGMDGTNKHLKRIGKNLPPAGSVRSVCLTDTQYARMIHWVGRPTRAEKSSENSQLLLI